MPHILDHVDLHLVLRRVDYVLQLLQRLFAGHRRRRFRHHCRVVGRLIAVCNRRTSNVKDSNLEAMFRAA